MVSMMMMMTVKGAPVNREVRKRSMILQFHLEDWREMLEMANHLETEETAEMMAWMTVKEIKVFDNILIKLRLNSEFQLLQLIFTGFVKLKLTV